MKCLLCDGMFVFVLVCVTLPTASLPNSILIAQVGSWWKTQHIAGLEASKCTGSDIVYSIPDLKSLVIHLIGSITRGILKHG